MNPASLLPSPRRAALAAALLLGAAVPALAPPAFAQGFGESFGGLQVSGDQPISIESNQLDVDDGSALATFSGDVSVQQGEMQMKTDKLLVHYDRQSGGAAGGEAQPASAPGNLPGGSSDITRLEATGSVYVKSADQVATAERADFDMASQVVTMTGDVVLSQGENVATGCVLTIQMETGVARLQSDDCGGAAGGGRVRMLLTPDSAPAGQ